MATDHGTIAAASLISTIMTENISLSQLAVRWSSSPGRRRPSGKASKRQNRRIGKALIQPQRFAVSVTIVAERINIKALANLPMVANSP